MKSAVLVKKRQSIEKNIANSKRYNKAYLIASNKEKERLRKVTERILFQILTTKYIL